MDHIERKTLTYNGTTVVKGEYAHFFRPSYEQDPYEKDRWILCKSVDFPRDVNYTVEIQVSGIIKRPLELTFITNYLGTWNSDMSKVKYVNIGAIYPTTNENWFTKTVKSWFNIKLDSLSPTHYYRKDNNCHSDLLNTYGYFVLHDIHRNRGDNDNDDNCPFTELSWSIKFEPTF